MSLIHQALKKAQRERLAHEVRAVSPTARLASSRPSRRWLLFAAGLALALGAGAILHAWLPWRPAGPPPAVQTPPAERHVAVAARSASPVPVANRLMPLPRPPAPVPARRSEPPAAVLGPDSAPAQAPPSSRSQSPTAVLPVSPTPTTAIPPRLQEPPTPPPSRSVVPTAEPATAAPVSQAASQPRSRAQEAFERAVALQASGHPTQAIAFLKRAVGLDPALKDAYNLMGNLYYHQAQYADALEAYQNALRIDPDFVKARNNLGSTYLRLARIDQARTELHKVVQTDDSYGLAYYNLACVYARGGDSPAAARYLQRAIQLEPAARSWALSDEDFSSVRTAPELQRLLGPS